MKIGQTPPLPGTAAVGRDGRSPAQQQAQALARLVTITTGDPLLDGPTAPAPGRQLEPALPGAMGQQAAMQLDQAALRRMVWEAPDPAVLSLGWKDRMLGGDVGRALAPLLSPSQPLMPAHDSPATRPDPHFLPVYAWGGSQLMLALAVVEENWTPWRKKRHSAASLRLELDSPFLGPLLLEMYWTIGGLELTLVVERPESVEPVRSLLPAITQALRRASLVLLRVNVVQGTAAAARQRKGPAGRFGSPTAWQSLLPMPGQVQGLFRGLAEAAVVLMVYAPGAVAR